MTGERTAVIARRGDEDLPHRPTVRRSPNRGSVRARPIPGRAVDHLGVARDGMWRDALSTRVLVRRGARSRPPATPQKSCVRQRLAGPMISIRQPGPAPVRRQTSGHPHRTQNRIADRFAPSPCTVREAQPKTERTGHARRVHNPTPPAGISSQANANTQTRTPNTKTLRLPSGTESRHRRVTLGAHSCSRPS